MRTAASRFPGAASFLPFTVVRARLARSHVCSGLPRSEKRCRCNPARDVIGDGGHRLRFQKGRVRVLLKPCNVPAAAAPPEPTGKDESRRLVLVVTVRIAVVVVAAQAPPAAAAMAT